MEDRFLSEGSLLAEEEIREKKVCRTSSFKTVFSMRGVSRGTKAKTLWTWWLQGTLG